MDSSEVAVPCILQQSERHGNAVFLKDGEFAFLAGEDWHTPILAPRV